LVNNGSSAILLFSNSEEFGRSTAATQYLVQMAGFLGVPVLAWNADNTGIEKVREVMLPRDNEKVGQVSVLGAVGQLVATSRSKLVFLAQLVNGERVLVSQTRKVCHPLAGDLLPRPRLQLAPAVRPRPEPSSAGPPGHPQKVFWQKSKVHLMQFSIFSASSNRYDWTRFCVVTTEIAGHDDFVQAVRDEIASQNDRLPARIDDEDGRPVSRRLQLKGSFVSSESNGWNLSALAASECRISLLYATQSESAKVMTSARTAGLTGKEFVWIAAQSVVGDPGERSSMRQELPEGMLGVHFDVRMDNVLEDFVSKALAVFMRGVVKLSAEMGEEELQEEKDGRGPLSVK